MVEGAGALKPGDAVPTGNGGFTEAEWVTPGMMGDVVAVGLLVLCCGCKQKRPGGLRL